MSSTHRTNEWSEACNPHHGILSATRITSEHVVLVLPLRSDPRLHLVPPCTNGIRVRPCPKRKLPAHPTNAPGLCQHNVQREYMQRPHTDVIATKTAFVHLCQNYDVFSQNLKRRTLGLHPLSQPGPKTALGSTSLSQSERSRSKTAS